MFLFMSVLERYWLVCFVSVRMRGEVWMGGPSVNDTDRTKASQAVINNASTCSHQCTRYGGGVKMEKR